MPDECLPEPLMLRRRRPRVLLVFVIVAMVLMYPLVLLSLDLSAKLVVPTTAAIFMLAGRMTRLLLSLIEDTRRPGVIMPVTPATA